MTDVEVKPDVERYTDLDPAVREMLEQLRPDEVAFLQQLIRTMSAFGTVGKFVALIGGAIIGLVIGFPMLIDALIRIWSWLPHKGP